MSYLLIRKNDRYRRNSPISSAHRIRGGGGNQSRQDPSLSHGGGGGSGGGNSFVVPWLRSSSSGSRNGTGAFHHHSSNGAYRSDANDHSGDSGVAVANDVGGRVQLQMMAPQVQHQQPHQQQQGQQQNIQGLVSTDEVYANEPSKTIPSQFIPENPARNVGKKLFMDEESADILFEVHHQNNSDCNLEKKAKISPVMFYAHRLILQKCAPLLAEMCGPVEYNAPPISISIPDVTPEIFHHVLYNIYGGETAGQELEANAKEIVDAADRYGVSNLKLEAEACLVNTTVISVDNVMDLLLYADSKNCALLKEAVMDFIVENGVEVLDKVSFQDAPTGPTMFRDVLAAVVRGKNMSRYEASDEYCTMRITELRMKAHEKGLDVDGSREMLIATLKERS